MALSDEISDHGAVSDQRIWRLLKPWITPAIAAIERRAVYTFRSSVAAKWRCGRLLIAGDSAHLTPPFMGQGMCAGIRDAANLAWKLAIACRQPQRADLLETYQAERDPHVRRFIETAVNLGRLINSVDPHTADALRTADNNAVMTTPAPTIGTTLSDWLALLPQTAAGTLCSQPLLQSGQSLDTATGYRFALITTRADLSLPVPVFNAASQPALNQLLQKHNAVGLLLRPDRYIGAVARTDAELDTMLAAITHAELHKVQSAVTQH
jgi:3-(3-hydroxy-phenyl)propionate hydroxylase